MGLTKTAMMESEARGWDAPDSWVCAECIEDPFLKVLITENAEACECSYCGHTSDTPTAAPAACVMEAIADTVFYWYGAPQDIGVPYEDGEWAVQTSDTAEVLRELELDCQDQFYDDVLSGFHNSCWADCSEGFWAASRQNQLLPRAWKSFVKTVKHQTRFHFLAQKDGVAYDRDYLTPDELLSSIAEHLRKFGMLREIPGGSAIFRCRVRNPHDEWDLDEAQLGAPPSERASAGRMNPAGISYFYGAFEPGTAIGEVVAHPPTVVALGAFMTTDPLTIADLTKLPPIPSVFDGSQRDEREAILFLWEFTRQVSRPIQKNGMEHIEYVPSQVVCEYLAQVFEIDGEGRRLDGIIYPSSIKPGHNNIVLFPSERSWKNKFDGLAFVDSRLVFLEDWNKLTTALSMTS
ncbi:HEPN-associated N-terminal domain-containing protein [Collimonas pratensis]|uniref:RES domain protein n=1 Tax=Collimonas pratensis TaxID=279113 RepID=A0ABM5Z8C7_9BURK|nr:HEPN-associated N-terminal domain-containing protein [Collimonas pratensis]AMP15503.1 RES domain protein [Collimonas pratensis]